MKWIYWNILVFRTLWRRNAEQQAPCSGGTPVCKGDIQRKILHYILCGHGLTANPRLQFCSGRRSLANIHELTLTGNFRIRTPPLSVAGLVIFTKVVKTGGFFKFAAQARQWILPFLQQLCFSIINCKECWNILFCRWDIGGWIWPLEHIWHYLSPL